MRASVVTCTRRDAEENVSAIDRDEFVRSAEGADTDVPYVPRTRPIHATVTFNAGFRIE